MLKLAVTLGLLVQDTTCRSVWLHLVWGSLGVSLAQSARIHGFNNCVIPKEHYEESTGAVRAVGVLWHLQVQHVGTRSFSSGS